MEVIWKVITAEHLNAKLFHSVKTKSKVVHVMYLNRKFIWHFLILTLNVAKIVAFTPSSEHNNDNYYKPVCVLTGRLQVVSSGRVATRSVDTGVIEIAFRSWSCYTWRSGTSQSYRLWSLREHFITLWFD